MAGIKDSDNISFPVNDPSPSPFDVQQNNSILPREMYIPGTATGNSTYNLGGENGVYIDGANGIYAGSKNPSQAPFYIDLNGNLVATSATISGDIKAGSESGSEVFLDPSATVPGVGSGAAVAVYDQTHTQVGYLFGYSGSMFLGKGSSATSPRVYLDDSNSVYIYAGPNTAGVGGDIIAYTNSKGYIRLYDSVNQIDISPSNPAGTGTVNVLGDFTVSGVKSFDIEHPDNTLGKRLRYICPESPESLIMCRGKGKVTYPKHFMDVVEVDTIQVIKSGLPWNRSWIATAIRKGYKEFEPEYMGESPKDWRPS